MDLRQKELNEIRWNFFGLDLFKLENFAFIKFNFNINRFYLILFDVYLKLDLLPLWRPPRSIWKTKNKKEKRQLNEFTISMNYIIVVRSESLNLKEVINTKRMDL